MIAIGADHGGLELKEALVAELRGRGEEVVDVGTDGPASVDYPDFGRDVAERVSRGDVARGVLICTNGIGMSIVANKFPGVRAALVGDATAARMAREHNDANILALGARITAREAAIEILETWLGAKFQEGRHARRVDKIVALDRARSQELPDEQAR
jgi:RpiB/LacA/LacB family sugar-phosphate isomerase